MKQVAVFLVISVAVVTAATVSPLTGVRLENGNPPASGRVTVQVQGQSESVQVCSNRFGTNEANAVCKSLQYNQGTVMNGQFGLRPGTELLTLSCSSSATSVTDCSAQTTTECSSIAGVQCSSRLGATGTLGLEGGIIGAIIVCLVAVIGIGIGLGVCLYKNDLCNCFGSSGGV